MINRPRWRFKRTGFYTRRARPRRRRGDPDSPFAQLRNRAETGSD